MKKISDYFDVVVMTNEVFDSGIVTMRVCLDKCVFLSKLGSAHISSSVLLAPIPASPTAAATFTFAGNAFAPSAAEPLKINTGTFQNGL